VAKHPPTGGGKKFPAPTSAEELVLASLEGRPSLEGIDDGVDTAEQIEQIEQLEDGTTPAIQVIDLPLHLGELFE
jgi:hypothetical protein